MSLFQEIVSIKHVNILTFWTLFLKLEMASLYSKICGIFPKFIFGQFLSQVIFIALANMRCLDFQCTDWISFQIQWTYGPTFNGNFQNINMKCQPQYSFRLLPTLISTIETILLVNQQLFKI